MNRFLEWFDRFCNQYQGMRRSALIWSMILASAATYQTFWVLLPAGKSGASEYATVVGLFATAIGLYTWSKK